MRPFLLHQLLSEAGAAGPDAVAVIDRDRSITYQELDQRASQLASLLVEMGLQRGDRVALLLEKSLESIIGIYGVLRAGGVYVPLDPAAPEARLSYIAANCGIRYLLTGTEKARLWPKLLAAGAPVEAVVVLNGPGKPVGSVVGARVIDSTSLEAQATSPSDPGTIDLDLAYILYTSGSTGDPKGVMLSHLNAMTFVQWGVAQFSVGPQDRLSNHAPLHFDLSIFDIFVAAAAGATLVLVPSQISVFPVEVVRFIEHQGITIWYSVPSILTMMTLRGGMKGGEFPRLRELLFAGEVFATKHLRQLMALLPHVAFHNLYGPTETNVCTYYRVPLLPEHQTETIPIGKAIADVEVFAVTDDGRRAELGEVGELYVRGTTVMNGYWGDRERTDRVLVPNPLGGELRDLAYRTGDLVQQNGDQEYRFLGRRDAQIKSRGYRIELGDIEATLYANPSVVECAVVAVPDEFISNRIKAYLTVRGSVQENDLVRFCSERIPRYMIPEIFEFRDALPKTSTGKIDRHVLSRHTTEQRP